MLSIIHRNNLINAAASNTPHKTEIFLEGSQLLRYVDNE
jgi:hypothetical protein